MDVTLEIAFVVARCFHTPSNNNKKFIGSHHKSDICMLFRAYINLAAELGLWVILCPGPYISAELDLGGLPR